MTDIDIEILLSSEVREAIERNIERDPARVALDKSVPYAAVVATQVKYLQRARRKLPSLYEKRCIIPPRAFEQSSSEESAERKALSGDSVLDLTCGLGIDAMALARRFRRVVALERDAVLADVVRANLRLLGIENVEVVTVSAEEYVATAEEHFDWVFADPDRRSDTGRKMVCMEDCSPNIIALMPRLREISDRQAIKLSPMFDCEEAFRLLSPSEVEVVSIAGECKELNIYTRSERDMLRIAIIGRGEWLFEPSAMHAEPTPTPFDPSAYRYMIIPDVALQKARVAIAAFAPSASIWSNNGYAFATEMPSEPIAGRVYAIESIDRYRPKELKRQLKGIGVELLKRDTSLSIEAVRRQLALRAGNERVLALTTIEGENWVIALKPI
ncbi:MAG: class I SAM-dependent methyltransferase [Alistipes sp.]|nr:class I SAM-dependent methyltransferase [Alistipes sp.]